MADWAIANMFDILGFIFKYSVKAYKDTPQSTNDIRNIDI